MLNWFVLASHVRPMRNRFVLVQAEAHRVQKGKDGHVIAAPTGHDDHKGICHFSFALRALFALKNC